MKRVLGSREYKDADERQTWRPIEEYWPLIVLGSVGAVLVTAGAVLAIQGVLGRVPGWVALAVVAVLVAWSVVFTRWVRRKTTGPSGRP